MTSFPKSWGRLAYPHMREELLGILSDICECREDSNGHLVDDAYHFFFDDTAIAHNPDELIGVVFLSDQEVAAAWPLIATLSVIRIDHPKADAKVLTAHPRWPAARRYARELLDLLQIEGQP